MENRKTSNGYCHECQLKRGAVEPEQGLAGTTCALGFCGVCGLNTFLQPSSDYHWPEIGLKAIWD